MDAELLTINIGIKLSANGIPEYIFKNKMKIVMKMFSKKIHQLTLSSE